MEDFPATFGYSHHRCFDYFCQDGNLSFSGLPPGFSFHPRWENFLVDGIHLTCLTIGAEKSLPAMEQPWKRSFFSIHRLWYKLLGDGKMCRNKIFQSIGVEISFPAMEESGWTSFSRTIRFDNRPHVDGRFVPGKLFAYNRNWSKPKMDVWFVPDKLFAYLRIRLNPKMDVWFVPGKLFAYLRIQSKPNMDVWFMPEKLFTLHPI